MQSIVGLATHRQRESPLIDTTNRRSLENSSESVAADRVTISQASRQLGSIQNRDQAWIRALLMEIAETTLPENRRTEPERDESRDRVAELIWDQIGAEVTSPGEGTWTDRPFVGGRTGAGMDDQQELQDLLVDTRL